MDERPSPTVCLSVASGDLAAERAVARTALETAGFTVVEPATLDDLDGCVAVVGLFGTRYGEPAVDGRSLVDALYRASGALARLLYVKDLGRREPRLAGLLRRIAADAAVTYTTFATPAELEAVLAADLAVLGGSTTQPKVNRVTSDGNDDQA